MIIVSQDREQIVNFDNIEIIFLNQREVWYQGIYGEGYLIAEYSTEERAKEVLQEIIRKYSSYLQLNGGPAILQSSTGIQPNIFNIPKVYEMPTE